MRRVLVTGDRNWSDHRFIIDTLDNLNAEEQIDLIIEGCAAGADRLAGEHGPTYVDDDEMSIEVVPPGWAWARHVTGQHYSADWRRYGRAAGPLRNMRMLAIGRPTEVVAFHDDLANSRGTKDMVTKARRAGVPVRVFSHTGEERL